MISVKIFDAALLWLRDSYDGFTFFTERDVVWTMQLRLIEQLSTQNEFKVFNDYAVLPGTRRAFCTDLAIVDSAGRIEVAVEFKYEPSHERSDIKPTKFPVCSWGMDGIAKDIERARRFVQLGRSNVSRGVFIDEGGYFRARTPHQDSHWDDWYPQGPSVLMSTFGDAGDS